MKSEALKLLVKEKYGQIAEKSLFDNQTSCCGSNSSCCDSLEYSMIGDEYKGIEGHVADADLGLGCGLPTAFAQILKGDTVVDLGSGAGNDCFVARSIAGETGHIIGVEMTPEMVAKAQLNAQKLGYTNVEFVLGDIENLPIPDEIADVVVSNCVLNLVPDKQKAFDEMYRILKMGAHFSISDVVLIGDLPASLQQEAEMYAGCVAGAIQKQDYLATIKAAGFRDIQIQKEKKINIPEEVLLKYLNKQELVTLQTSGFGIYSITVFGKK